MELYKIHRLQEDSLRKRYETWINERVIRVRTSNDIDDEWFVIENASNGVVGKKESTKQKKIKNLQ